MWQQKKLSTPSAPIPLTVAPDEHAEQGHQLHFTQLYVPHVRDHRSDQANSPFGALNTNAGTSLDDRARELFLKQQFSLAHKLFKDNHRHQIAVSKRKNCPSSH